MFHVITFQKQCQFSNKKRLIFTQETEFLVSLFSFVLFHVLSSQRLKSVTPNERNRLKTTIIGKIHVNR